MKNFFHVQHKTQFLIFFLDPVNGNYTVWSTWSFCPVNCGSTNAVRTRRRYCSNPSPSNNGLTCIQQSLGPSVESDPCGRDPCPGLLNKARNEQNTYRTGH